VDQNGAGNGAVSRRPSRIGVSSEQSAGLPPARMQARKSHGVAARPHAAPGMLSLSLDFIVHAVGIIRPVECEPIAYQPLAKVSTGHTASCDGAPILIQ
jgi:hypothetical protein